METLYEKLAEILEEEQVKKEDELRKFENWDSLSLLITLSMIDTEYGVIITSDEFEKIKTIGDLEQMIEEKKGV